jgi:hypothetical protein
MYDRKIMAELVSFVGARDGINDKAALCAAVAEHFALATDRKVYSCSSFAIRFSRAAGRNMGNTVLSLSALQKYDSAPFLVCIVTPDRNYLLLANTTFLKKISHSSQALRQDNIKGSFNGSDIMKQISGLENAPENFEELFAVHEGFSFEENLKRLVEATNHIVGTGKRFVPTEEQKIILDQAPERAADFLSSECFRNLRDDLRERVKKAQSEIATAASVDNVNIRGRVIEYLISSDACPLRTEMIDSLRNGWPLPEFKTKDGLGDYSKQYPEFLTETDIKTKVLSLTGNPKAYNIDKLLEFLSREKSVYLIFIVGIDENGDIAAKLCSIFSDQLLSATKVIRHWAGRNSRGVAQFNGRGLSRVLGESDATVDLPAANAFLKTLVEL